MAPCRHVENAPPARAGQVNVYFAGTGGPLLGTHVAYLNRPSAIVVGPTQANDIHRNLAPTISLSNVSKSRPTPDPARSLVVRAANALARSAVVGPSAFPHAPPRAGASGYFDGRPGPVLRDNGTGDRQDPGSPQRHHEGDPDHVRRSSRVGPHAEDMTRALLGIPWAEKWPAMRYCGSVAIRTLPAVSGGGLPHYRPDRTFFRLLGTTYSRSPSAPPIHPAGRARTKAPAARWGFRLIIFQSSSGFQHPVGARPAATKALGIARSRARRSIRPWRRTGSRISGETDHCSA